MNQVELAGGGARALDWLLSGMEEDRITDSKATNDPESIRSLLKSRGFEDSVIEAMVAAVPRTEQPAYTLASIPLAVRERAELQARQIALAMFESRLRIADLKTKAESPVLKSMYESDYAGALQSAGLDRVELVDRFPVLTAQYGYTRGKTTPGVSKLRTYRELNGDYILYGDLAQTEALFVRLRPLQVHRWLSKLGFILPEATDERSALVTILESTRFTSKAGILDECLLKLVHSYAHALIRRASLYAGIDRSSLSELVLPYTLGFFVYAPAKGDFVLGGLQALFETELHILLRELLQDDQRCALDPGCNDNGAACAVCLHLGEPSCRLFNTFLSRRVLAGGTGYFDVTTGGII